MNTYIRPTELVIRPTRMEGTFYDPALLVACMDPELTNLLNVHLDEPDGIPITCRPRPAWCELSFIPTTMSSQKNAAHACVNQSTLRAYRRVVNTCLVTALPGESAATKVPQPDFRREWDLPWRPLRYVAWHQEAQCAAVSDVQSVSNRATGKRESNRGLPHQMKGSAEYLH